MKDLDCPYCGEGLNVCHDDGWGYQEGIKHHMDCYKCGKTFVFQTEIYFDYYPEKAECLNGEEHVWKPTPFLSETIHKNGVQYLWLEKRSYA
jgi:hypothetical protein